MKIELTAEQAAAFERGEDLILSSYKPVEKWEPDGGCFQIYSDGAILNRADTKSHREFGTERKTYKQGEKAAKEMRISNRLRAYVDEFAPDWVADWDDTTQTKWSINFNHDIGEWNSHWTTSLEKTGAIYMPGHVAKALVEKLNNGTVEL